MTSGMDPNCRFCPGNIKDRIIGDHGTVLAFEDRFPVTEGHCLVVPKRHTADWFTMSDQERRDAEALILALKDRLVTADQTINGFNIGTNCGQSAGQTIFHAHIHLIPRRDGDTPNPTGGVRGVIPDKMCYCLSTSGPAPHPDRCPPFSVRQSSHRRRSGRDRRSPC